jgi:hypothetical protein
MKAMRFFSIALLVLVFISVAGCFKKSAYSNCVVAASEEKFTGEWLKSSDDSIRSVQLTEECKKQDGLLDGGNGPKKGRVRWAVCYAGPDCSEAGVY